MELQQVVALILLVFVYAGAATGWVHRAAIAAVGAVVALALWGLPSLSRFVNGDLLLVTAGLMVLAGFVRRSGLASWLALKAAKVGRGRASHILALTGVVSWLIGAALGPIAAVSLLVPVALLLAVELDVPALPFVVVLTWTAVLGAATTLTALPGNLWLGAALNLDAVTWVGRMAPLTTAALAGTLITGALVFRRRLRVTNERRARVLEYDESQSLENRPLVLKTALTLVLVGLGWALGPWLGLSPSVVTVGGAVLLWLMDSPRSPERPLADLEGGTLLFFGALMLVVGAVQATGLLNGLASQVPHALLLLMATSFLGTVVDQGALIGLLTPLLQTWATEGRPVLWPLVVLGATVGAGVSGLGSMAAATAVTLTGQGARRVGWRQFSTYGLLFAAVNLAVAGLLWVMLG